MERIVSIEEIHIDADAREFLLEKSGGSVRNLISNLEKIYIYELPVSRVSVERLCSTINVLQFEEYIRYLRNRELAKAIAVLYDIHDYGYSVIDILDYFFGFVKSTPLLSEDEKYRSIPLLCRYITIFHNVHENCIELALFTNNLSDVFVK